MPPALVRRTRLDDPIVKRALRRAIDSSVRSALAEAAPTIARAARVAERAMSAKPAPPSKPLYQLSEAELAAHTRLAIESAQPTPAAEPWRREASWQLPGETLLEAAQRVWDTFPDHPWSWQKQQALDVLVSHKLGAQMDAERAAMVAQSRWADIWPARQ